MVQGSGNRRQQQRLGHRVPAIRQAARRSNKNPDNLPFAVERHSWSCPAALGMARSTGP
jgi:hypothetical protein